MLTKNKIDEILNEIADKIDISEELFDQAEREYTELGKWIDQTTPQYKIDIYPQGSFALGTVVRPITDDDDYDLDLVCQFNSLNDCSPERLKKSIVKPLLDNYDSISSIEEKKRCWQVRYNRCPQFHMDIIPATNQDEYIDITDKNEDVNPPNYAWLGSNPKGYIAWFNEKKKIRYKVIAEGKQFRIDKMVHDMAELQPLKEYHLKTPLQKAIQLFKRHRDIMFQDDPEHIAPISIIITTISAQLYQNEDSIYDTLYNILINASSYVKGCVIDNEYHIDNPSYTGNEKENFAEKWKEHPERAEAFFDWLEQAKTHLVDSFQSSEDIIEIGSILAVALGEKTIKRAYTRFTTDSGIISKSLEEPITALIPRRKMDLLSVPHRQSPPWTLPKGHRVIIKAIVTDSNGSYVYKNDGSPIDKHASIMFTAIFSLKKPYSVRWQIVNTGHEAQNASGGLRGQIEPSNGGNTRIENTLYTGSHYVQCFVTQYGQCIAKSDIFIVNIK